MARLLLGELERPSHPAQTLIAEQISLAFAAHVLRNYNVFDAADVHEPPSLGRFELSKLTNTSRIISTSRSRSRT